MQEENNSLATLQAKTYRKKSFCLDDLQMTCSWGTCGKLAIDKEAELIEQCASLRLTTFQPAASTSSKLAMTQELGSIQV